MPVNLFFIMKEMMQQNGFTFNPSSFSRLSQHEKKNPVQLIDCNCVIIHGKCHYNAVFLDWLPF